MLLWVDTGPVPVEEWSRRPVCHLLRSLLGCKAGPLVACPLLHKIAVTLPRILLAVFKQAQLASGQRQRTEGRWRPGVCGVPVLQL